MTKQELLSLEHLAIAEETKFVHVHTEDGYIMTVWKEDENILKYAGSECYYMPIREEYPDYRIITVEEHNELEKKRDEAIKESVEEYKKEVENKVEE